MSLLARSTGPVPSAFRVDPLTVEEIDAHPDSARLWATIHALREEHENVVDEAYEQGKRDAEAA